MSFKNAREIYLKLIIIIVATQNLLFSIEKQPYFQYNIKQPL